MTVVRSHTSSTCKGSALKKPILLEGYYEKLSYHPLGTFLVASPTRAALLHAPPMRALDNHDFCQAFPRLSVRVRECLIRSDHASLKYYIKTLRDPDVGVKRLDEFVT